MGSHLGPDWSKWPELALVGQMAGEGGSWRGAGGRGPGSQVSFLVQGPEVEGWREPQGGWQDLPVRASW